MRANQGNKDNRSQILFVGDVLTGLGYPEQPFLMPCADRHDQPNANYQLPGQRVRDPRTGSRDDDHIEGRLIGKTLGSVVRTNLDIVAAQAHQAFGGGIGQDLVPLDRENPAAIRQSTAAA